MAFVILLATSGNQPYLFATNKLKEIVGASELTWRSGTQWVLEAVRDAGGPPDLWADTPSEMRRKIMASDAAGGIEILVATSGKAILIVDGVDRQQTKATAQCLVRMVTKRALKEAPGIDVCGAIEEFDPVETTIHAAIAKASKRFEEIRRLRPSPESRHPLLPVVAQCSSSGLPANFCEYDLDKKLQQLSAAVRFKREKTESWKKRAHSVLRSNDVAEPQANIWIPDNLEKLEKAFQDIDWVAVIHADGNGMGRIFQDFSKYAGCESADRNEHYIKALRDFSIALDEATEGAFVAACKEVLPTTSALVGGRERPMRGIVPLVLGGDDLTVIVDARYALEFTVAFLHAFERETEKRKTLKPIARERYGVDWLSACAGVAIIKPNFPFHTAYELAESLLKSAKGVKKVVTAEVSGDAHPCSALDFHVLFDASFTNLEDIRGRLQSEDGKTCLTAGPYVTTPLDKLKGATGMEWASAHQVDDLKRIMGVLGKTDDQGRRQIPNSQLHALREALFVNRDVADGRLQGIRHRYDSVLGLCEKAGESHSLFRERSDGVHETRFLDALISEPFWNKAKNSGGLGQ